MLKFRNSGLILGEAARSCWYGNRSSCIELNDKIGEKLSLLNISINLTRSGILQHLWCFFICRFFHNWEIVENSNQKLSFFDFRLQIFGIYTYDSRASFFPSVKAGRQFSILSSSRWFQFEELKGLITKKKSVGLTYLYLCNSSHWRHENLQQSILPSKLAMGVITTRSQLATLCSWIRESSWLHEKRVLKTYCLE